MHFSSNIIIYNLSDFNLIFLRFLKSKFSYFSIKINLIISKKEQNKNENLIISICLFTYLKTNKSRKKANKSFI
jgi:hypothetical protein